MRPAFRDFTALLIAVVGARKSSNFKRVQGRIDRPVQRLEALIRAPDIEPNVERLSDNVPYSLVISESSSRSPVHLRGSWNVQ